MYPHPAVIIYFYPRPLRGGRRAKAAIEDADEIFLSTPSARRATHELDHGQRAQVISIHALCEEGDVDRADVPEGVVISIHALCEEGDHPQRGTHLVWVRFLSTPSARRATFFCYSYDCACQFLSTPSARRATRVGTDVANLFRNFYPRPLRGGRRGCAHGLPLCKNFYPRPLRGGRRGKFEQSNLDTDISIHALCEEGDPKTAKINANSNDFYPRPLRGGRQ